MKKIFTLLLFVLLGFLLFTQKDKITSDYNYLIASPCDQPLTFRIGQVDKGYGLTADQLISKTNEAGQIWDEVVNKTLFKYNSEGKIVINLIYSERQSMSDNISELENNLTNGKQSLNTLNTTYTSLSTEFENKMQAFNTEVSKWNSSGGAPKEIYDRLQNTQKDLQAEADKLNALAAKLNLVAKQYNLGISQFNKSVDVFNKAISIKPEVGLYNSANSQIDIYLTSSDKELIHTLAHEMGHSLGLGHVDEPNSIMNSITNEIVQANSSESAQLRSYCQQKNLDIIKGKIKGIVEGEIKIIQNKR